MKKNKVFAAIVLSMLFVVSSVMSALAAPSPDAVPTKPVAAVDKDGKDVSADVKISAPTKEELPEGTVADMLKDDASATPITSIKVDTKDGETVKITVDAPGVKAGDTVYVMVYDPATKTSKKVAAVAGDNVVTFELDKDAIVVIVKGVSYTVSGPAVWTIGSGKEFMFKGTGDLDKFKEVKVDGAVVDKANYDAKKGSTEIYFKAAYLDTLKVGEHSLEMVWNDGTASATFKVVEADASKPSGDVAPIAALSIMAIASMLVAAGLVIKSKKAN